MNYKVYYITGVSGCGKSTIGKKLSDALSIPFYDGDDFHPESNIRKMTSGEPLKDQDRYEWLNSLNKLALKQLKNNHLVISCSALTENYRKILKQDIEDSCHWIFLSGSFDTIAERLKNRKGHFMPDNLLQSQFDTLEEPGYGLKIDINMSPQEITEKILNRLKNEI